jgi:soluble lytic murein transglycosylase-like protein
VLRRPIVVLLAAMACRPAEEPTQTPADEPTSPTEPIATATTVRPAMVIASAKPTPAPAEPPWKPEDVSRIRAVQPLVHAAAREYGVDPNVMNAIIWHESKFHAKAKGPGGAAGLMQLMPTTSKGLAKRLGVPNRPYDPKFNVQAGAYLLSRLLKIFDGDLDLALAGYALGHVAVKRRLEAGEPLPERTQRFIARVHTWSAAFAAADELKERRTRAQGSAVPRGQLAHVVAQR